MFEKIKGKILLKQSAFLGMNAANVAGYGETFDDTDDLTITYIMGAYYLAIVHKHLRKREKDVEKIDWIVLNAINVFIQVIPADKLLENRMIFIYNRVKDTLSLDNENDENHEMYDELVDDYLFEIYGKHFEDDLMRKSYVLSMLVPVYTAAVNISKEIKL